MPDLGGSRKSWQGRKESGCAAARERKAPPGKIDISQAIDPAPLRHAQRRARNAFILTALGLVVCVGVLAAAAAKNRTPIAGALRKSVVPEKVIVVAEPSETAPQKPVPAVPGTPAAEVPKSKTVAATPVETQPEPVDPALGRELFAHIWVPNDPRSHGGDGLGPVYNETSCLACHSQGKPGGAGPKSKNVELLVVLPGGRIGEGMFGATATHKGMSLNVRRGLLGRPLDPSDSENGILTLGDPAGRSGGDNDLQLTSEMGSLQGPGFRLMIDPSGPGFVALSPEGELKGESFTIGPAPHVAAKFHPGLANATSAVVHRSGLDPRYAVWRKRLKNEVFDGGENVPAASLSLTRRSAPPLFGAGLIDTIPDELLVAMAARQPPKTRGKVSRMKDGSVGKFGWKAQVASLRQFVLLACANELGLEVPGQHQPVSPTGQSTGLAKLDLTAAECASLEAYIRALPPPLDLDAPREGAEEDVNRGRGLFQSIGCAECHVPTLASAHGIYSDLLLHDLGSELASGGSYYTTEPTEGPTASEWRTPPLWGLRDSGPYLHDGRAESLHDVVTLHGGQAKESSARFFRLSPRERAQIIKFLDMLPVPDAVADAVRPISRNVRGARPVMTKRARTDEPTPFGNMLMAGQRLESRGDLEKAIQFYRMVARNAPGSQDAEFAVSRLKALEGD